MAAGRFVDPLGDQGVVNISHGHQPCRQGNLLPHQAIGIAAAIPVLMMPMGDLSI